MIILIGPSASGKTEIAKALIKDFNFEKFVTTTTRKMRLGETQDVDYHFISKEEFLAKIENNEFIETVQYNDNFYGTYKKEIGENKVIILEPNGLEAFLSLNEKNILTFFINCDLKTRQKRMKLRGDNPVDIEKRLLNDDKYFENAKRKADFIITNDESANINELANKIYSIYKRKKEK